MMKLKVSLHRKEVGWLDLVVENRNDVQQLVDFGLKYGLDINIEQVKDDAEQDH